MYCAENELSVWFIIKNFLEWINELYCRDWSINLIYLTIKYMNNNEVKLQLEKLQAVSLQECYVKKREKKQGTFL